MHKKSCFPSSSGARGPGIVTAHNPFVIYLISVVRRFLSQLFPGEFL